MSVNQTMSEEMMSEPSAKASVLRKRKREQDLISLQPSISRARLALEAKFECPEGEPEEPESALVDHPDYSFYSLVAGTIPDTRVDDFIRIPSDIGDVQEKHSLAVRKCSAAHTALFEVLGKVSDTVEVATNLEDDYLVAKNVREILTSQDLQSSDRVRQLQLLRDVREYLAGTAGVTKKANALRERIETVFPALPIEDSAADASLGAWLREFGDRVLQNDDLIGAGPGDSKTDEEEEEESKDPVFSADAAYYPALDDIEFTLREALSGPASISTLESLMRDFDEDYRTEKPEDGAWEWLTAREREVTQTKAELDRVARELTAATSIFDQAKREVEKLTGILSRAREIPPDEPIPVNEEMRFAVQQARTVVETTNREAYEGVTVDALIRSDMTVKTTFAHMVGLLILRARLQFPDRYRPVMTAQKLEDDLGNDCVVLADYEFVSGYVRKTR